MKDFHTSINVRGVHTINYFNWEEKLDKLQIIVSGVLLYYLRHTFKHDMPQLRDIKTEQDTPFLEIDKSTMSSLEIIDTINGEKNNSLFKIINKTLI